MKLFQTTIPVAATLYIKASDAEEAAMVARGWANEGIEVDGEDVDGRAFKACLDDPDFVAKLSPAMTVGGFPMGDSQMRFIDADDMEEVGQ